ncbi:MAG: hypothetical protein HYZ15_03315 [Sphingobacteriales bacterium]|nr:hypothetical protein [Sphingobacteriales bacterium]
MRKLLMAVFFIFASLVGVAQVYIQPTVPTVGLVQKSQLWNLVLVNGTTASIEGRLELILFDRQSGLEMFSASTNRFTLSKGSMTVNVTNLNPVQYNYQAMDGSGLLNNLLPAGAYRACYSFSIADGSKGDPLAQECVIFDVEPLSPPMLIFPMDSALLETMPGQFSWTPPTPVGMFNRLSYEVFIAEIQPGQKADEALQNNLPFYSSAGVNSNFLSYSAALPAFEKGKWYGWQVVARDDKNYASRSGTWVFTVKEPGRVEQLIKGTPFMKMKPGDAESGIAPNGILKLSYYNRSTDSTAWVTIRDLSAEYGGQKLSGFQVKLLPGENQIEYKLKKVMELSTEPTYEASIVNSRGEKSVVLFRVIYFKD